MKRLLAFVVLVALLLVAAQVSAQQQDQDAARSKFADAVAAHQRGDYLHAAAMFEEAYFLAPAAGAKFNAGASWDAAGEVARAADAYETSLEMGGLAFEQADQARRRLSALERTLGYLKIDEPVGATVNVAHVSRGRVPLRVHVPAGTHSVRLEAGGKVTTHEVHVGAGETRSFSFKAPAQQSGLANPQAAPRAATSPAPVPPSDRVADPGRRQRTWGWVAVGAGAVLTGAAIGLGLQTLSANKDWDDTGHDPDEVDKRDRAVTFRTLTNVAWGGAVVASGVGVALLLTAPSVEF